MKKICMVCSISYKFDTRVIKIARSIIEAGFDIDLICPWNVKEGMNDGIYYRPFHSGHSRLSKLLNYPKIWRLISDHHYDLYHFHHIDILPLFALFSLFKKKPVIYDVRENYSEEMLIKSYIPRILRPMISFFVKWGEYIFARIIKNLVVVVDSLEKNYKDRGLNVVKVRNFASRELERERIDNYDTRPTALIFTGLQYIGNGSLLYLEIARKVHTLRPKVKFYNVARFGIHEDKALKQVILNKIKEYKLHDTMIMLPNVKPQKIMSYINLATIAILPNLNQPNQKMAIVTRTFEYMAGCIPIVASNHPYHIKFIENNKAGLLANPDYPEEFVEKILYLVDNRKEAKKIGKNGLKAFREKLNWEEEAKKLIQMYRKILKI